MKSKLMPSIALTAAMQNKPAAVIGNPRNDAGAVDAALKEVQAALDKIGSDVKFEGEKAMAEVKKLGALTEETKAAADKALSNYNTLSAAQAKLEGKLEALETHNLNLEQMVAAGGRGGANNAKTLGEIVANHENMVQYRAASLTGSAAINVENAITKSGGATGGLIAPDYTGEIVGMPRRTMRLRDIMNVLTTPSDVAHFAKQVTRTQNGGMTAEGAAATESVYEWIDASANVKKVVAMIGVSDEALKDAAQLAGLIDSELRYEIDVKEEDQLIAGSGTGNNLKGLLTFATAFSAASGLPNAERIDRLRLGMLQVALAGFSTTGIILNPVDWAAIELLKDTTGRYIYGDPNTAATPRLWGADVVETTAITAGEWLAGNTFIAASIYDREGIEVLVSSEHADNFAKGMKTAKATKRLALADKRPASIVKGNFTFA